MWLKTYVGKQLHLPLVMRMTTKLFYVLLLIGLSACGGRQTSPYGAVRGRIAILAQHCYADPNYANLGDPDADVINTNLQQQGWTITEYLHDDPTCNPGSPEPVIFATNFTDSIVEGSDALWFSGHGAGMAGPNQAESGFIILYNFDQAEGCPSGGGFQSKCFAGSGFANPNLPYTGTIKWFFTSASQAVKLTPTNWTPAFNSNANGLHGFYGFEYEPIDIYAGDLATTFLDSATRVVSGQATPASIHTAWINAAAADQAGGNYGILELQSANSDVLSGNSASPPYTSNGQASSANPVIFYDASGQTVITPPFLPEPLPTNSPGYLQAHTLTTEGWSDSYLAAQADKYEPGSEKYYLSSNQYRVVGSDFSASHYESSSAVIIEGARSSAPYTYTQSDAQNFAQSALSAHGGIPGDAVLAQVVTHYSKPAVGATGSTLLGYDFIWRHSDGRQGGDFIQVGVDNIKQRYCSEPNPNDPPYNKPPCLKWDYQYNQRTNFMYRLWRQLGSGINASTRRLTTLSGRRITIAASGTGLSPAAAYTSAQSQPPIKGSRGALGSFVGYNRSYWLPSFQSTDNTAYPAYHFYYSNHYRVSVNAISGRVVGASSY